MMKNITSSRMSKPLFILKSKLFVAILFCLFVLKINGQVTNYSFSQSNTAYVPLTSSTTIRASGWDDHVDSVSMPFTFNFNGVDYSAVSVNSNGYITFGATDSGTTSFNPISSTAGYSGAVSAFGRDLISNASTIVYGTEGVEPNRVFVVQWNNARRYSGSAIAGDILNFQIRLYEASNVVQVRYGSNSATSTANTIKGEVGLRGSTNTDYNNRSGGNNTAWNGLSAGTANNNNVNLKNGLVPASGLTFTWTPITTVQLTTASVNPFTVPCGVTSIIVEAWGAGGGGGRSTTNGRTTGGGGGGAYAKKTFAVNAGDSFSYSVGSGGSGSTGVKNGGDTWFDSATSLMARGGKGATNDTENGSGLGGGQLPAEPSVGDIVFKGGNGGNGNGTGAVYGSGGGGGGARTFSDGGNGGNGSTFFVGIGGVGGTSTAPGGNGGDGEGTASGTLKNGINYGGGGGGAKRGTLNFPTTAPIEEGGNGAPGYIRITHTRESGTNKTLLTTGNWNTASNWSPGSVPTNTSCVIVPSGKTVNVDIVLAEAKSVNVHDGGILNISANQTLRVQEAFVNQGVAANVVVASDANLLQVNNLAANVGKITVKRNSTMKRQDYTYWASPVKDQKLKAFSPATLDNRFLVYNTTADLFDIVTDPQNSVFASNAKGYAIRAPNNFPSTPQIFPGSFVGEAHNGVISYPLEFGGNGNNLVGNPYPSNIDFYALHAANSGVMYNTAYFWTNVNPNPAMQGSNYPNGTDIWNNYAILNGTGGVSATTSSPSVGGSVTPNQFIKVGQGFIVKAKAAGNLNFNNTVRTDNDTGHFFNRNEQSMDRFWLTLNTPLNVTTTQLIGYTAAATSGFELDYDAPLFVAGSDAFYSILEDRRLAIQGKGLFTQEDVIALGSNHYGAGTYKIALGNKEGVFASGQSIYLKDKQLNILTDLTAGDYTFTSSAGEFTNRFEIVYKPEAVLATDATNKSKIEVYRDAQDFVVRSAEKTIENIELYDAVGRLVFKKNGNSKEIRFDANRLAEGMYIVKAELKGGEIFTKKIRK